METLKKISFYILVLTVLVVSIYSVLAIWEIVELPDRFISKSLQSLLVVFVAGAVLTFLNSVVFKGNENKKSPNRNSSNDNDPVF